MKWHYIIALLFSIRATAQQTYTASFVAKMGNDTVIVETYNMYYTGRPKERGNENGNRNP